MKRYFVISYKTKSVSSAALLFFLIPFISHAASFNYQLLEDFPGVSGMKAGTAFTDLPSLINGLYKFGIWTVGIAALFMLVIGGFMYMTSAGNTSRVGSAKSVIGDALLGLVAALGAFLLLYVINPDLTKINLHLIQVSVQGGGGTPGNGTGAPANTTPVTPGNGNGSKAVSAAQQMMNGSCYYCNVKEQTSSRTGGADSCSLNSCKGTPAYTDCSNFVNTAYTNAGCKSPGSSTNTILANANSSGCGDQSALKTGDIVIVSSSGYSTGRHAYMCENDGCTQKINAAGTKKGIREGDVTSIANCLGVISAANYCQ